jgi:H+-transporting ATPase
MTTDNTQSTPPHLTVDPDPKNDLKSLPLHGVEKQLGTSPDGLSQAEADQAVGAVRSQ